MFAVAFVIIFLDFADSSVTIYKCASSKKKVLILKKADEAAFQGTNCTSRVTQQQFSLSIFFKHHQTISDMQYLVSTFFPTDLIEAEHYVSLYQPP